MGVTEGPALPTSTLSVGSMGSAGTAAEENPGVPCERPSWVPRSFSASQALREHHRRLVSYIEVWSLQQDVLLSQATAMVHRSAVEKTASPTAVEKTASPTVSRDLLMQHLASGSEDVTAAHLVHSALRLPAPDVSPGGSRSVKLPPDVHDLHSIDAQPYVGLWVDPEGCFNEGFPVTIRLEAKKGDMFQLKELGDGTPVLIVTADVDAYFIVSLEQQDTISVREPGTGGMCYVLRRRGLEEMSGRSGVVNMRDPEVGTFCHRASEGSNSSVTQDAEEMAQELTACGTIPANQEAFKRAVQVLRIHKGAHRRTRPLRAHLRSWRSRLGMPNGDAQAEAPKPKGCMSKFVGGQVFEMVCMLVIISNSVFIAWHANYTRTHLQNPTSFFVQMLDLLFCVFYTLEWISRFYVAHLSYFVGKDWQWNWFDTALVVLAIYDQVMVLGAMMQDGLSHPSRDISFLRVMRIIKMLKLLRMIRLMKMFRELRLILNSIFGSLRALLWSMFLMVMIIFVFGICLLQATTEYLMSNGDSVDVAIREDLDEFWGDGLKAMQSMYMSSTNGEDWRLMAKPLIEVGGFFYVLFIFYTFLYTCVIANTLTSLFVEATIARGDKDQEQIIKAELERKDYYVGQLRNWYSKIDSDKSGAISYEEIQEHMNAPEMHAFAARMGIDMLDVQRFYNILSSNGQRDVDLETFVVGCMKLKGPAKSMDLAHLIHQHRQAARDNQEFARYAEKHLSMIGNRLSMMMGPDSSNHTHLSAASLPHRRRNSRRRPSKGPSIASSRGPRVSSDEPGMAGMRTTSTAGTTGGALSRGTGLPQKSSSFLL